jgi:hypothetical protein
VSGFPAHSVFSVLLSFAQNVFSVVLFVAHYEASVVLVDYFDKNEAL